MNTLTILALAIALTVTGILLIVATCQLHKLTHLKQHRLTFIDSIDWEGVYLDGKLIDEGYPCQIDDSLRSLGIEVERLSFDDLWPSVEIGSLPNNLEDVKRG